jgi:clan AA aspartic protease
MPNIVQEPMGKIVTALTITNRADEILTKRGAIAQNEIRSVTLDNVLVDTGATTLCLPAKVIESLGLEILRTVDVETATGISQARIFQDAKISLLGREGTFECLELPGSQSPLLGVIPLEALGIELDLQKQTLRILPISPTQTYLTIL